MSSSPPPPPLPTPKEKEKKKSAKCLDHVPDAKCDLLHLQALNDFIDRKLQASPIKSLIVYPEGNVALQCTHTLPFCVVYSM